MTINLGAYGFGGLRIVTNSFLTMTVEDWSEVRSPSRARRRMKRGFRQRVKHRTVPSDKIVQMGETLVMHPAMLPVFEAEVARYDARPARTAFPEPAAAPARYPMMAHAPMFVGIPMQITRIDGI